MKMLMLAALAQTVGSACDQPVTSAAAIGYYRAARACVSTQAARLSRSGERADLVATAAITVCTANVRGYRALIKECGGWELADEMVNLMEKQLRDDAIARVVQIRARR